MKQEFEEQIKINTGTEDVSDYMLLFFLSFQVKWLLLLRDYGGGCKLKQVDENIT